MVTEKIVYGPHLKWACFACRKCFKQRVHRVIRLSENFSETTILLQICPQCSTEMCITGNKFKPPRRNDVAQWKKAELLIKAGFLFNSGPGFSLVAPPAHLGEVSRFLEKQRLAAIEQSRQNRVEVRATETRKRRKKRLQMKEDRRIRNETQIIRSRLNEPVHQQ